MCLAPEMISRKTKAKYALAVMLAGELADARQSLFASWGCSGIRNADVRTDLVEMLANSSGYRLKALEAGYCLHLGSLMAESNDGRIVLAHWVMKNLELHLQTETEIADVTVDLLVAL
jgi:hypothetical protein